ncbi:MAG: LLM class flavin-dependent oxidoreductase [Actinomycetota bacterium]|nr:MAG: LLM class flavin-dependent oxidoreductase [Actinomycetota bacterium]
MKVRVGIGIGEFPADARPWFDAVLDACERLNIDSIWLSQRLRDRYLSPFVAISYAAARTTRLKLGTSVVVLPGTNPVLMAEAMASIAVLAPRRFLPVFGLGPAYQQDRGAFPVSSRGRGHDFDESLVVVRRLLEAGGRTASATDSAAASDAAESSGGGHSGIDIEAGRIRLSGFVLAPQPDPPLDLWVGGRAPAALRRAGRLADGWLGSGVPPSEAEAAVRLVQQAAAEAGRVVDPEHFGMTIPWTATPGGRDAFLAARRGGGPAPGGVPVGWQQLRELLDAYIAGGLSKFVVRPVEAGAHLLPWLDEFAAEVLPLQT